jgi:lysophospholipase L1-like esterase
VQRLGQALATLALFVGSLLCVGVVAELLARSFWTPPRPSPPPPVREEWRDLPQIHSVLAMNRPNQRFLVAGALFETNEHGFRGPSRRLEPEAGRIRSVIIGDSFAMGWGVVYEDTYGALIEAAPTETAAGPVTLEVLNFALAGVNTGGAVARLRDEALAFAPELVVYGASLNDIEGPHYRASFTVARGSVSVSSTLWQMLAPRVMNLAEGLWPLPGSYVYDLDENYFRNEAARAELGAGLDALAEILAARDVCGLVLLHTQLHRLKGRHPYRRHYDALAGAARERGLPVVRSFPKFAGREPSSLWAQPGDTHPGPEAHRLLAEALGEGLRALPAHCFTR